MSQPERIDEVLDILQCPVSGNLLTKPEPEKLQTADGITYPIRNGIAVIHPDVAEQAGG